MQNIPWWVPVIVVVVILIWIAALYNVLVRLRNHVRESFADIDTELKRRYDLIPQLVETVKGYAKHEREVFERVTAARNQMRGDGLSVDVLGFENGIDLFGQALHVRAVRNSKRPEHEGRGLECGLHDAPDFTQAPRPSLKPQPLSQSARTR